MVVKHRTPRTRGMTILELLLALSLSALVLYLVGLAIDLQWRLFDTRRSHVEETLLARAVLRRVADDLRGAVLYTPPDLSGLDAMASSPLAGGATSQLGGLAGSALGGAAGGTSPTGSQNPGSQSSSSPAAAGQSGAGQTNTGQAARSSTGGQSGSTAASGATASGAANSGSTASADGAQPAPSVSIVGLYGSQSWLAIDVSRLPRIDEYESILEPGAGMTPIDIPSDVKTVTYYVAEDESGGESTGPSAVDAVAGHRTGESKPQVLRGLIRQQLSRAVSSWNEIGGGEDTVTGAQVLAEEVTAVEFAYFDGVEWYTDWSSTDQGGLPVAVAIALQFEMKGSRLSARAAAMNGDDEDTVKETSIHRLIVQLPGARKMAALFPAQPAAESTDPAAGGSSAAAPTSAPATNGAGT